jgi:hypothetical protein
MAGMRNEVINRISRLLPLYSIESSEGRRQDGTVQQVQSRVRQRYSAGLASSETPELALLVLGSEGPRHLRGRRSKVAATAQLAVNKQDVELAF